MADNYQVLDASGAVITISAKDIGAGVYSANVGLRDYPAGQALMAASLPVVPASNVPGYTSSLESVTVVGALNDVAVIDTKALGSAAVQLVNTGTFVGTVRFDGSADGTNWQTSINFQNVSGTSLFTTIANASMPIAGVPRIPAYRFYRAICTAYTSGSCTITWKAQNVAIPYTQPSIVDNAAFTDGASTVNLAGFVYDEVAGTALTENDAAAGRIDDKRAMIFALEDATTRGRRATVSAAGELSVRTPQLPASLGQAASAASTSVVLANDIAGTTSSLETSGNLGALNDAVTLDLKNVSGASFQVPAGTFSGTIAVEVSLDNSAWVGAQWSTPTSTTVSTTFTQASLPLVGLVMSSGFRYVRLRVSIYTSGSTTAIVRAVPYSYNSNIAPANFIIDNAGFTDGTSKVIPAGFIFDETAGTALTENDAAAGRINANRAQVIVGEDETNRGRRWTISAAGELSVRTPQLPTALGQAAMAASTSIAIASDQPQVNTPLEATGTISGATAVTLDLKNMGGASVQIVNTGSFIGTLQVEGSNDNTTWGVVVCQNSNNNGLTGTLNSNFTQTSLPFLANPLTAGFRYLRVNCTAYTSGTCTVYLCAKPSVSPALLVAPTQVTDNGAFTDGSSRVNLAGYIFDEVAGTALTENDGGAARMDSKRSIIIVGEDATTRGQRWSIDAQGALSVKEKRAATPTQTSVGASATNVTVLASNSNRLGATIFNDSTVDLYLKLGATASTSSFTVKMAAASYYEVPFGYTGIIDGIWASATGNARITELAA